MGIEKQFCPFLLCFYMCEEIEKGLIVDGEKNDRRIVLTTHCLF